MLESFQAIDPYALALGSLLLTLGCAAFPIYRRWTDLRQSITSMVRSMERLHSDISRLPWIEGVVTASSVRSFPNRVKQSDRETTMYRPEIAYAYSIDGKSYSGVGDTFHIAFHDSEPVAEICARYPPGTRVRIYFRRDEPSISYLDIDEIHSNLEEFADQLQDFLK